MLATAGDELPLGDEWTYELKWDGIRAMAYVADGRLHLMTRNGIDVTDRYPELAGLAEQFDDSQSLVFDGEIVALEATGAPSFARLQRRMALTKPHEIAAVAAEVPVNYAIFDVVSVAGEPTTGRPYHERRELLDELVSGKHAWSVPRAYDDGEALLARSLELGMEGVMAKRVDSRYLPGKRTKSWLKIKQRPWQEFVLCGWTDGKGARAGTIGAILVGAFESPGDEKLRYYGRVGTGFDMRTLADIHSKLLNLATDENPFATEPPGDVHFAVPEIVAEVEYQELTPDGHLRHPIYRGMRQDKDASEVVFEGKV